MKPPLRVLTLATELALEDIAEATGSDSVLSMLHLDDAVGLCGLLIQCSSQQHPQLPGVLQVTPQWVQVRVICSYMQADLQPLHMCYIPRCSKTKVTF